MNTNFLNKLALIVDDDIDFLNLLELQLKQAGFKVVAFESQDDAEQFLSNQKPDLVITDLMMENFDAGFALSYHVKKKYPDVPVILVTGVTHELGLKFNNDSAEEKSWIKADAVLNKPIRFEQLVKEIIKFFPES